MGSLDFVSDSLLCNQRFRILNVTYDFGRECQAAVVDTSLSGDRVVRELDRIQYFNHSVDVGSLGKITHAFARLIKVYSKGYGRRRDFWGLMPRPFRHWPDKHVCQFRSGSSLIATPPEVYHALNVKSGGVETQVQPGFTRMSPLARTTGAAAAAYLRAASQEFRIPSSEAFLEKRSRKKCTVAGAILKSLPETAVLHSRLVAHLRHHPETESFPCCV